MRKAGLGVAGVVSAVLVLCGSASAATVVGNNCIAGTPVPNYTAIALTNPANYPLSSTIPSSGVITSWSVNFGGLGGSEPLLQEQLKVFAPTGIPNQFKVVGESEPATIAVGVTTSPTRIPVQGGDLLGNSVLATAGGKSEHGTLYCSTGDPGDQLAFVSGDPGAGATVQAIGPQPGAQNPVLVTVEPDADGDDYGDETQDKCPTDKSTQGDCPKPQVQPPPSPPLTIGASAAAKNGLVIVTLTASAQANVTVTGSVKLGKGQTATVNGGTQVVTPGALAKVPVLFPPKLKSALKQLPKSKKLTLTIAASAPGATTTNLTVKVPGQKKVPPLRHGR